MAISASYKSYIFIGVYYLCVSPVATPVAQGPGLGDGGPSGVEGRSPGRGVGEAVCRHCL